MGLALSAGMVAFLNPCGFALLPSYIAHYLGGRTQSRAREGWWERGLQGLMLGGVVSAGFFTVFLLLGSVVSLAGTALGFYFPWAAIFLGLGLMALGILTLVGRELALPLSFHGPSSRQGIFFYYLYGISYAIASCGCTLPIFMIYVVGPALSTNILMGFFNFIAYASGMTLMMLLLSVSMAYSKGSLDRSLPLRQALIGASLPVMIVLVLVWTQPQLAASWGAAFSRTNRIFVSLFALALPALLFFQVRRWEQARHWLSGLLLIAAGGYLIYYQVFEYGILR